MSFSPYFRKLVFLSAALHLFTSVCFAQSIEAIDGETDKSVFYKLHKGLECVFVQDNVLVVTEGLLSQVDSAEFRIEDTVGQYVTVPINRVVRLQKCSCHPREQRNPKWPYGYQLVPGPSLMSTPTQQPNQVAGRIIGAGLGSAVFGLNPMISALGAARTSRQKAPPVYTYWEFITHPEPK